MVVSRVRNTKHYETIMKRLIIALTVAAFAIGAQAGEGCGEKSACGAKEKAPASCPASKEAKDGASCPAKKDCDKKAADAKKSDQAKKS